MDYVKFIIDDIAGGISVLLDSNTLTDFDRNLVETILEEVTSLISD